MKWQNKDDDSLKYSKRKMNKNNFIVLKIKFTDVCVYSKINSTSTTLEVKTNSGIPICFSSTVFRIDY